MKIKTLVMLGIILGIASIFIGAIISTVFPSSENNLLPYRVSSSIKLIGIGLFTSSLMIGGIAMEDVDRHVKLLLLLLGLVLLIIYTVGSQSLQWNVPTSSQTPSGNESYTHRPIGYGIPGFEAYTLLAAFIVALVILKRKHPR
jgi:hypothetical protein